MPRFGNEDGASVAYIGASAWCEDSDYVASCLADDHCVTMSIDLNEEKLEERLTSTAIMRKLNLMPKRDKYHTLYLLHLTVS